jgi:mono/diheme cytochrome c family protein
MILAGHLAAGAIIAMPGCRGDRSDKPPRQFFPDMDDAPKFKPQSENPFFLDNRSMRPVVEGTVPFGRFEYTGMGPGESPDPGWQMILASERAELLKDDDAFYRGITGSRPDGALTFVERIPIPVTQAMIARGQERYGIYCAICHGEFGRGEGMVGQRWAARAVANLMDPKYMDLNEPDGRGMDGFLFHTAMNGVPDPATGVLRMPAYSHALSADDAWAVVAYIRVLQEAQSGTLEQVPEPRRGQIAAEMARRPAAQRPPVEPTQPTQGNNP